jgi:hypothetical protein
MVTSHQAQDSTPTTPVTLPDLTLGQYREIVATMQAQDPDAAARIGRGLAVLMGADIRATAETGRYLVQSCQDAGIYYVAPSWSCSCPDRQRHEDLRCKHSFAVELLNTASAVASYDRAQARYTLTAKGARALAAAR